MKNCLVLILLAFLAQVAAAQSVYKWVDENGDVHYSQALPPEQAGKAHDRLTGDGLVAERVQTAEELEILRAQLARQREQAEGARIQAQRDRLFLAAYPTEDDVRRTIEKRREAVQAERESVESLIDQSRGRFAAAVAQAADLERRGDPVPEHLLKRIDEVRAGIRELSGRLNKIDERLLSLNAELEAELERHRRLMGLE